MGALNIDRLRIPYNDGDKICTRTQTETVSYGKPDKMSKYYTEPWVSNSLGRWPANIIADRESLPNDYMRFFQIPKPTLKEKNIGCADRSIHGFRWNEGGECKQVKERKGNPHATVKPIRLFEMLVVMVTREDGLVLDPFAGSGTTGIACKLQGRRFVGIEQLEEYAELAKQRISALLL